MPPVEGVRREGGRMVLGQPAADLLLLLQLSLFNK